LLGLPIEQLCNRRVTDLFPDLDVGWHFGAALERGETVRRSGFELRYMVDGQQHVRHWDFVNVPIFDDDRKLVGLLGMALEVSDQFELQKLQAEQNELLGQTAALKDQFLGILSHELRTPINAVMGFASVLDDELAGALSPEQKKYTERILAGADLMLSLVDDLLDMSRILAGRFGIDSTPMDFAQVVDDVVRQLEPLFEQYGGRLASDVPADLPPVLADPARARQVLASLLANAARYGATGDTRLVVCQKEGCLRCEIHDQGRGVSPEEQARLVRAFGQLDTSATRAHGGLGLGLAISRAIVETLGGHCGVESEVGQGSMFWFTLPLAQ
jgi:two-component system sensor histidine kinase/response regulator